MRKINFTKMVASGNDFIVFDTAITGSLPGFARSVCRRKFSIGADGLLLLGKSRIADIKMRVFNADGSEAEMCGNGARCAALYAARKSVKLQTRAGIIQARVNDNKVKIRLTDPKELKLDFPVKLGNRTLSVNFINTGVPHTVIFVQGLEEIDVVNLGRKMRHHKIFSPRGTNVNFIEVLNNNSIKIRTYERGVEDETLACGTGSTASAIVTASRLGLRGPGRINLHTRSGEILKVYFNKDGDDFKDVWLEGRAKIVYKGVLYV